MISRFSLCFPINWSQLGPGMAWADVNADGNVDCYICGARGQIGSLQLSKGDSAGFTEIRGPWSAQIGKRRTERPVFRF